MNLVVYLILWVAIGLFAGVMSNWVTNASLWPWFVLDLLAGVTGALLFGYCIVNALFGMCAVLSAYSLASALFGACLFVLAAWGIRKLMA